MSDHIHVENPFMSQEEYAQFFIEKKETVKQAADTRRVPLLGMEIDFTVSDGYVDELASRKENIVGQRVKASAKVTHGEERVVEIHFVALDGNLKLTHTTRITAGPGSGSELSDKTKEQIRLFLERIRERLNGLGFTLEMFA